jgi:pimeloyl-ACP methyl ester carboxylesterase
MDLPVDERSATFDDYADVVCAAVDGVAGDDLILVGHSMAGLTAPLVAARKPLRRLVYLCGVPPIPGRPFRQQMAEESDMLDPDYPKGLGEKDAEGRRSWIDKELAHFHVLGDCDEATASTVFSRLRPQSMEPYKVPCSLTAYPDVDTAYVVCDRDRMVNPRWSRRIARDWLKAELIELPGDHSPFYSQPSTLAGVLDGLG